MRRRRPGPAAPLFVYPAAQLAVPRPEVARGPERARGGEGRRVPAGRPAQGYRRREGRPPEGGGGAKTPGEEGHASGPIRARKAGGRGWSCQVSWLGGAHKAQVESPVGGTRKECLANGKGRGVQL